MSTGTVCQIPGNPDIAGVGVRTSVYIQACLAGFNLIYMVHTRLFNPFRRSHFTGPDDLDKITPEQLQLEASSSAVEVPAANSLDIERRSLNTGRSSPLENTPSIDADQEDAKNYRAFVHDNREYLDMAKILERGLFMVGFAVIVSSFLEAKSTGLTAYHALVILNISQLNNWSGFVLLVMRGGFRPWERSGWASWFLVTRDSLVSSIPCTLHAIMMSGLGLYFWSDLKPFLNYAVETEDCQYLTYLWLFGPVDISNRALRKSSLVFYAISATPIIGLYIFGAILVLALLGFLLIFTVLVFVVALAAMVFILLYYLFMEPIVVYIIRPLFRTPFIQNVVAFVKGLGEPIVRILRPICHLIHSYTTALLVGPSYSQLITFPIGIFLCAPLVYTIVSTELTIRINKPYIEPETEERWTYGQTLALFTALVSLALYMHEVGKLLVKWRRKVMKDIEHGRASPIELESPKLQPRPLFVDRDTQTDDVVLPRTDVLMLESAAPAEPAGQIQ